MKTDFCVRMPVTYGVISRAPHRDSSFLRGTHHGQTFRNDEEVCHKLLRQSTVRSQSYFRLTVTDVSHLCN